MKSCVRKQLERRRKNRGWLIGDPNPAWCQEMRAAGVSKGACDLALCIRDHIAKEEAKKNGRLFGMDAKALSLATDDGLNRGLLRFASGINSAGEEASWIEPTVDGYALLDGMFSSFGGGAK